MTQQIELPSSLAPRQGPAAPQPSVIVVVLILGTAGIGACWAITESTMATGLAGLTMLGTLAVVLRLKAVELITMAMAVSFYLPRPLEFNVSLADVLLPILVLARMRSSTTPALRRLEARVLLMAGAIVGSVALSGFLASLGSSGLDDMRFGQDAIKILFVGFVAVLLVRPLGQALREDGGRFTHLWLALACALSVGAVLTGAGIVAIVPQDPGGRVRGMFEDPNLFAAYLIASMMVASFSRVARGKGAVGWEHLLIAGGVAATGSRGAAVAIMVGTVVYVLGSDVGQKIRLLVTVATVSGLAVLAGAATRLEGINRMVQSSGAAGDDVRFQLWKIAWNLGFSHPLAGVGLGQFPIASSSHNPTQFLAHNTFLSFLAETGFVGMTAIMAPIVAILVWLVRHRPHPLGPAWLAGWVALSIMMCTVNLQNARFVWFIAVLSAVITVTPVGWWIRSSKGAVPKGGEATTTRPRSKGMSAVR